MSNQMFFYLLIFFSLSITLAMVWLGFFGVRRYENVWKTLPRERMIGMILGLGCLLLVVSPVKLMLEGPLAKFQPYIIYLVPLIAIGSYHLLDFIFARALGGCMVLTSIFLLDAGMVLYLPERWIFSTACYLLGVAGLFLIGTPWRWRDRLEQMKSNSLVRWAYTSYYGLISLIFLTYAILGAC